MNAHGSDRNGNRVKPLAGWNSVKVSSVTLNAILSPYEDAAVFIKVDTRGFETQVYRGADKYLSASDNRFIKSEFAPNWLESQENSPEELLEYLISKYRVVEAPARTRFNRDSLRELFSSPLTKEDIRSFVTQVKSLNADGLDWVDLYIAPKRANKALE